MEKKKTFSIILITIFCSVGVFISYNNIKKVREVNALNTSLQTKIQVLENEKSELNDKNVKLNEDKSKIETKINEIENSISKSKGR